MAALPIVEAVEGGSGLAVSVTTQGVDIDRLTHANNVARDSIAK